MPPGNLDHPTQREMCFSKARCAAGTARSPLGWNQPDHTRLSAGLSRGRRMKPQQGSFSPQGCRSPPCARRGWEQWRQQRHRLRLGSSLFVVILTQSLPHVFPSLLLTVAINLIVQHIQDILNGGLSKRQSNGYLNGYTPPRQRQPSESSSRPH